MTSDLETNIFGLKDIRVQFPKGVNLGSEVLALSCLSLGL